MPDFGDADSPANSTVGREYLERTMDEVGTPNVVTAVLASYRGYDTMGEAFVIFAAGLGVMLILGLRGRRAQEAEAAPTSPDGDGEGSTPGGPEGPAS